MRTLMQVVIPHESGNKAIKEQSLGAMFEKIFSAIKPEATYFTSMSGKRCCLAVFDLKSPVDIPSIAEPFFMGLNADVSFYPVMNVDDLKQGLSRLG